MCGPRHRDDDPARRPLPAPTAARRSSGHSGDSRQDQEGHRGEGPPRRSSSDATIPSRRFPRASRCGIGSNENLSFVPKVLRDAIVDAVVSGACAGLGALLDQAGLSNGEKEGVIGDVQGGRARQVPSERTRSERHVHPSARQFRRSRHRASLADRAEAIGGGHASF